MDSPFQDLVSLLKTRAHEHQKAVLYRFLDDDLQGEERTYHDLHQRALKLAQTIRTVSPQSPRVLLLFPPGLDFIDAFFGALCAGAWAVPVFPPDPTQLQATLPRIETIAQDVQATAVLTLSGIASFVPLFAAQAPYLAKLPWICADQEMQEDTSVTWAPPPILGEDIAFVQYTSGSTGKPKGVKLSHRNLLHNQTLIRDAFGHAPRHIRNRDGDFGVSWLPLYHDMGLIGHILQPLFIGNTSNIFSPLTFLQNPITWLRAITQTKAHTSGAPNFAYSLCTRRISEKAMSELDLSHWRVAYCGAEVIRPDTLHAFGGKFSRVGFNPQAFYPTYGLAEATLFVTGGVSGAGAKIVTCQRNALEEGVVENSANASTRNRSLVACGQSHPDQTVLIVDPETCAVLPENRIGEIWVKGPSVSIGYHRNEEATQRVFQAYTQDRQGPFLRTGDLGSWVEGELYVTGRIKDTMICQGKNIYPEDLEACGEQAHSSLRLGAAAAAAVEVNGEEKVLYLQEVRNPELDEDEAEEIVENIRRRLLQHTLIRPQTIALLSPRTLPKTSSGKIRRSLSRALYLDKKMATVFVDELPETDERGLPELGVLLQSPPTQRRHVLTQSIQGFLAERLAVESHTIDLEHPIKSLGIDSMLLMDFTCELESKLGVVLEVEFWSKEHNLQALVTTILERAEAES